MAKNVLSALGNSRVATREAFDARSSPIEWCIVLDSRQQSMLHKLYSVVGSGLRLQSVFLRIDFADPTFCCVLKMLEGCFHI